MIEDGHPNDRSWFRIMAERLHTVDDLTDAALMEGVDAVVLAIARREERLREALSAIRDASPQSYDWYQNMARAALTPEEGQA